MHDQIDREKARQAFLDYASGYDMEDPKIRLKTDHTLRVTDLCETIAKSIALGGGDADTAWLCGLLHDIGRFEQVRIYHTFRDADSVDHAKLSADLLFQGGLIRRFTGSPDRDHLIETAIRCHNAFLLPDTLTEEERLFCTILRDADKIDILRVNRETPMTEIYNLPEEAFTETEISDAVYEDMLAHRNVNRAHSRTGIDFLMGHIAFVFGLVYPVSFTLVRRQGYLDEMLSFESRNARTRERMEIIRNEVKSFMLEQENRRFRNEVTV